MMVYPGEMAEDNIQAFIKNSMGSFTEELTFSLFA